MSGQQIGTVVGYVVGAYFGQPQLGAMIGGYIGGVIDPTQFNGPRIGDGPAQSSADGQPIAWIIGTGPCVGNICLTGPRYEVKKTDNGKGSTTQTNTFEAHQSFTIQICESCELRDSTIIGVLMCRQNGKIVYDVRPGSTILAESAKWKEKVEFYFGGETQMADPTMEAIFGIGETPFHRGSLTAVFRDFNRSEFGDAIPQFDWVVVSEGVSAETETIEYVAPNYSRFTNSTFPLLNHDEDYDFIEAAGEDVGGSYTALGSTILACQTLASGNYVGWGEPSAYVGYLKGGPGPYSTAAGHMEGHGATTDLTDYQEAWILYSWQAPALYHSNVRIRGGDGVGDVTPFASGIGWEGDALGVVYRHFTSHDATLSNFGIWDLEGFKPLAIRLHTKQLVPVDTVRDGEMLSPDLAGWVINISTGVMRKLGTTTLVTGSFRTLALESTDGIVYAQREIGPVMPVGAANDTQAFWDAAYAAAVSAGTMPGGMTYSGTGTGGSTTYPRNKASAYKITYNVNTVVTTDRLPLSTIVLRINRRGGLTDADIVVTELTDLVIGYPIRMQCTAADALRPLQGVYFFKTPEYDQQIHCIKDGADATLVVDPMDFIEGDEEEEQDKRRQEVEFPRKMTSSYYDPALDFIVGKGKAERTSPDVRAIGETSFDIPVVMDADEAWQVTEKAMKAFWTKLLGTQKFSVPFSYLEMVASLPFGLGGKRYTADQVTLDDGKLLIEASCDRQSDYTSNVTAIPTLPPTRPPSSLGGPTIGVVMNLPQLRAKDNSPGMYAVACGVTDGWPGCLVQLSTDLGASYEDTISINVASVIGNLTEDITDAGSSAEPIFVSVYGGELTNATDAQIASGVNGFAIIDAADVPEIGQFKTQDEVTPKNYELTETTRGELGTLAVDHFTGERFVMLNNVNFIEIDPIFAGQLLMFRFVTFGTDPTLGEVVSIVFDPGEYVEDGGSPG